jgi:hypothetical protein
MAGYFTYEREGKYYWRNDAGWIAEICERPFDTEEAAYKNCCEAAGLVVGEGL